LFKSSSDILLKDTVKVYFEAVKGNQKEALRYIEAYVNKEKKRKIIFSLKKSTLVYDKFIDFNISSDANADFPSIDLKAGSIVS
jgi:hypothetical protein